MRYYAIADLHGRYDLLDKAIEMIWEDAKDESFKIITLGDYIDRGPDSKKVIDRLMKMEGPICLMGNHEAMAVETIIKPLMPAWWMGNGGLATIKSYNSDAFYGECSWVLQDHVKWMAGLPLYHETPMHVFVHAGILTDDPLEEQDKEKLIWMLYRDGAPGGWRGKHVVHGHHQFADGPHEFELRTDLDTFAWNTGRLVIGVFDDTQGKALRYIEVLGDDYGNQRQRIGSTYS